MLGRKGIKRHPEEETGIPWGALQDGTSQTCRMDKRKNGHTGKNGRCSRRNCRSIKVSEEHKKRIKAQGEKGQNNLTSTKGRLGQI